MNIKDIEKLQKQQLETESQRYDHKVIDEQSQEFLKAAKQKRKLHRKHNQITELEGESDVDEEFKIGFEGAASKFGVKRKKKYLFNDAGIPMEPFNLENDIKEGMLTKEGIYKMDKEKNYEEDELKDPWYDSVRDEQNKMIYEKSQK